MHCKRNLVHALQCRERGGIDIHLADAECVIIAACVAGVYCSCIAVIMYFGSALHVNTVLSNESLLTIGIMIIP